MIQLEVEVNDEGVPIDHEGAVSFVDPKGWWKISARFDGCVNMWSYSNIPFTVKDDGEDPQLIDYLHICNITEFIETMQFIKAEMEKRMFSTK